MDIFKKPYELSLWEDVLTFVVKNGNYITEYYESLEGAVGQVIAQYYKERLICIIGSDTMDTPIRAVNGSLNSKINGENILTFDLYSHYYDTDLEEEIKNPYTSLIFNERKVKLRTGPKGPEGAETKWYDLVIKDIQEDSESKTYTYTAKDLFINELSKSGFNLEFATELNNNIGTVDDLADRILAESDWKREGSAALEETLEEPLYLIQLNQNGLSQVVDLKNENSVISISENRYIYAFYDDIVNKASQVQFLYIPGIDKESYPFDKDNIIVGSVNWLVSSVQYDEEGKPTFAKSMDISDKYRGKRLVRKIKTAYDSNVDKYVKIYSDGTDKEIYGYTEVEYVSPATVQSYITNAKDYDSTNGWEVGGISTGEGIIFPELSATTIPHIRDFDETTNSDTKITSYLELKNAYKGHCLRNRGLIDNRNAIGGFTQGEKYVFKIQYGQTKDSGEYGPKSLDNSEVNLNIKIGKTSLSNGVYTLSEKETLFETGGSEQLSGNSLEYKKVVLTCKSSLSYSDLLSWGNDLSLLIEVNADPGSEVTIYIQDVQFFPYIQKGDTTYLQPGEIAGGEAKTVYCYYEPSDAYTSVDDIDFLYKDYTPASYSEVYEKGFGKKRTITASESNRFNLLQDLAELFECWVRFRVEHEENGAIALDKDYRQKKWVSFYTSVEQNNYAGFKYGINLKSIKRNIDSEAIVSKLVVKNNSNEFATDGFCSITRASENPSGENFILDFKYYIQHNLISLGALTSDLYLENAGYLGYYKKLKRLNTLRDQYIKEQSGLLSSIADYNSKLQVYKLTIEESERLKRDKLIFIESLTSLTFEQLMADKENSWWESPDLIAAMASVGRLNSVIKANEILRDSSQTNYDNAQARYDWLTRALSSRESTNDPAEKRLLLEKEELHSRFYKKYSRFLQEGSWISEDHLDDQLYFLDARSTLNNATMPKISYDISVLELSAIEEFKNYTFALGDKTTMEDVEFFGWANGNINTPYKEEIIITEMTFVLDSPEENRIKVQNYKSNFEDLFQRIASTTQAIEYSSGRYNMVSNAFEPDGTLGVTSLQNAIANNALILSNSRDQSVIWDETGITAISLNNPAEMVRIVNGGIFLTADGGVNWETGITGRGINARQITAGQLDAGVIHILNGEYPSFRWDGNGLSAYSFTMINNRPTQFDYSKFIRFDQYGIYGINGIANFNPNIEDEVTKKIGEDKIWEKARFALTWKGFSLKSSNTSGGYISITSNEDLQVFDNEKTERLKLGFLEERDEQNPKSKNVYGLQLRNAEKNSVISIGYLWNKDPKTVGEGESQQEYQQVINTNDKFIVYEDGSMKATDGEFTGIVHATGGSFSGTIEAEKAVIKGATITGAIIAGGGQIGGLEIEQFVNQAYEVKIEVIDDNGTSIFESVNDKKTLKAVLYKNGSVFKTEKDSNGDITAEILGYSWYKKGSDEILGDKQELEVTGGDISGTGVYSCKITLWRMEEEL